MVMKLVIDTSHKCFQALVKSLLYYEIQFYCLTAAYFNKTLLSNEFFG